MAHTSRVDLTAGQLLIVPGMALALLGPRFFDGLVKGMLLGAGIMMMLLGVWLITSHLRRPSGDDDDAMWLPSRDAEPDVEPGSGRR